MLTDIEIANIVSICGQEPVYEVCKNHNLRIENPPDDVPTNLELKNYCDNHDLVTQFDDETLVIYR